MNYSRTFASTLILSAGVGQVWGADDVPVRYTRAKQNTVSVGMRMTNSSATVNFSGMGNIPRAMLDINTSPLNRAGNSRAYDNGTLFADEKFGDIATNEVVQGGVLNQNGRVVKDPVDRNSIYVINERPRLADPSNGKAVYVTERLNPIRNGKMIATLMTYKIKTDEYGFEVWAPAKRIDSDGKEIIVTDRNGAVLTEPVYERDSNGEFIPIEREIGEYLPHSDGYTRFWSGTQGSTEIRDASNNILEGYNLGRQYFYDPQGNAIGINFDRYGSSAKNQQYAGQFGDSAGFEISLERTLRRESLRLEWGLKGTLGFSGINGSRHENITADLVTLRHTYLVADGYGPISTDPLDLPINLVRPRQVSKIERNIPQFDKDGQMLRDKDGVPLKREGETTPTFDKEVDFGVPLLNTPVLQPDGSYTQRIVTADAATVAGFWQIKGSYYMFRFGPSARYFLSNSFSVSGSLGVGLAYYTTRFNIDEQLLTDFTDELIAYRTRELYAANGRDPYDNTKRGVTLGPVGEVNLEYWLTQRTGFYVGVAYESLGKFTQEIPYLQTSAGVASRKAEVKLGSGMTVRFGISTRF